MKLFELFSLYDSELKAERSKVHFAVWNGEDDPLDVYLAGDFDEWQSWQSKRNFELDFVISLIALPQTDRWLFVGAYNSSECEQVEKGLYRYQLDRRCNLDELRGRLVVLFHKSGRQTYRFAEGCQDNLAVAEIRESKLSVSEFPGYSWVCLTKQHLDIIVREAVESWRVALSNVAGVYVITDRETGRLYVGSATSGEGIWSRWCSYSTTGHGGNLELIDLLELEGEGYSENFQFGILEIADTHASVDDVLSREARWKELLLTREFGYNAN